MVWLPDGEKTFKIYLAVLEQYRHVTDGQTDILWERTGSPRYVYASCDKNELIVIIHCEQ